VFNARAWASGMISLPLPMNIFVARWFKIIILACLRIIKEGWYNENKVASRSYLTLLKKNTHEHVLQSMPRDS
jgi:hypothetical protein